MNPAFRTSLGQKVSLPAEGLVTLLFMILALAIGKLLPVLAQVISSIRNMDLIIFLILVCAIGGLILVFLFPCFPLHFTKTTLAVTTNNNLNRRRLCLLSLPSEVRVNILHRLLTRSEPIGKAFKPCGYLLTLSYRACLSSQILSTCKIIQHEGLPILWQHNKFLINHRKDIRLLKGHLPNQAADKDLIRHLVVNGAELLDIIMVRELQTLRMLETLTLQPFGWTTGYWEPAQLSVSRLQSNTRANLKRLCERGLQTLVTQRPQVMCIATEMVTIADSIGRVSSQLLSLIMKLIVASGNRKSRSLVW